MNVKGKIFTSIFIQRISRIGKDLYFIDLYFITTVKSTPHKKIFLWLISHVMVDSLNTAKFSLNNKNQFKILKTLLGSHYFLVWAGAGEKRYQLPNTDLFENIPTNLERVKWSFYELFVWKPLKNLFFSDIVQYMIMMYIFHYYFIKLFNQKV